MVHWVIFVALFSEVFCCGKCFVANIFCQQPCVGIPFGYLDVTEKSGAMISHGPFTYKWVEHYNYIDN